MTDLSRALLVFFSLLGTADSAYITYEEFAGVVPSCAVLPGFDCGAVLGSQWAYLGPVPLSLLGLGFYVFTFFVSCYALVSPKVHPQTRNLLALLGTSAFAFTLYLMYLQAVVIGAFCLFCLVSAFSSTGIFASSLWHRSLTKEQSGEAL